MTVLKFLCVGLFVTMAFAGIVLPEDTEKVRIIDGLGKAIFACFGLLALGYIWQMLRWFGRLSAKQPTVQITGRAVVVDGSNVMHWGGEPSMMVLVRVLKELQNRGLQPVVYFDANVGYKLFDKHIKPAALAAQLDLPVGQVILAPSRTPADEILLERAINDGLRVVTNDRFLDWKQRFPKVGEKGFLIKGMWKEGSVILLGLGRA